MRSEPCPGCGATLTLSPQHLERGHIRCERCFADVQLEQGTTGEGPTRTATHLVVRAPSAPARHEWSIARTRDALTIQRRFPATTLVVFGLLFQLAGLLAMAIAAALTEHAFLVYLAIAALGTALITLNGMLTKLRIVVDHDGVTVNGRRLDLAADGTLPDPLPIRRLAPTDARWIRALIDARLAGDRDAP